MIADGGAGSLPLPEALQFMQVLWRVVHGVEQRSKRMAVTHGVTSPQRLVLRLIGLQPGVSAGTLAATLHLHPSTLTGVLRRLQERGLIARGPHPADRRRAVLRLTARGRRVNSGTRGTVEDAIEAGLRRVSNRDRASARRALSAVADAMRG